ncbi:MAG: hypothetical protein A2Z34_02910 [Planctomycetes bacterium RBG_16_59_8]|nr:MAG: hypothetical protein A2Z34_02910 [Planctomycetes bacterium RBG_16_59_8]
MGEVPVALVVPRPTVEVKPSELLEHCHSRLPPVKIPRKIVFVEQLPRSALGKVNRNQLRRNLSLTEENS